MTRSPHAARLNAVLRLGRFAASICCASVVFPAAGAIPSSSPFPASATASVSVSDSASGSSHAPIWSADGQAIAFVSLARNLTSNDVSGRFLNVYLRELNPPRTTLVSVNSAGTHGGNGHSVLPSMSSNAMTIAFESEASDLAGPGPDANRVADIFVRDMASGMSRLISTAVDDSGSGNGPSRRPQLSADGRHVVFESLASNLVTNDFNGAQDIFTHDLESGVTELVSVNAECTASADGPSDSASISTDGSIIAFVSLATNLVAGVTNRTTQVYVRQVRERATIWAGVNHVAARRDPALAQGTEPKVSPDGRFVAFKAGASSVARLDLSRPTNTVLNRFPIGGGVQVSNAFIFENNPRYRVLPTPWIDLPLILSGDARYAVVVLGITSLSRETIQRVDFETFETFVEIRPGPLGFVTNQVPSLKPWIEVAGSSEWPTRPFHQIETSADGTTLLFQSDYDGWDTNVVKGAVQLFVLRPTDAIPRLVSTNRVARPGASLGGTAAALSPTGQQVAYETPDALVTGDLNHAMDVYLRDLAHRETSLISARADSNPSVVLGGASSVHPHGLSADGRWLVFSSAEREPAFSNPHVESYVWLRDLLTGTNQWLHPSDIVLTRDATISADGRYVTFIQMEDRTRTASLSRLDRETGQRLALPATYRWSWTGGNRRTLTSIQTMSRNGRFVALWYDSPSIRTFYVRDWEQETNLLVGVNTDGALVGGPYFPPVFSPDSRWLAFGAGAALTTNGLGGLHLRDLREGLTHWLANGYTDVVQTNSYAFSADSRFIVFARSNQVVLRSLTTPEPDERIITASGWNPGVSGDGRVVVCATPGPGEFSQIVRFDGHTQTTNLISRGQTPSGGGNGPSVTPVISADGRFVVFASRASDLVANDRNGTSDVFVRDTLLGTTLLASASVRRTGTSSGNGPSFQPVMGVDGRTVLFHSFASDLMEGDHNERQDVYLLRLGAADSDRDGLDDDWEQAHFSALSRDGAGDFDGDGVNDRTEFLAGTAPTDDASILRVMTLSAAAGSETRILWSAAPGRTYQVEFKPASDETDWQTLPGLITATSATASAVDPAAPGPAKFYRVLLVP